MDNRIEAPITFVSFRFEDCTDKLTVRRELIPAVIKRASADTDWVAFDEDGHLLTDTFGACLQTDGIGVPVSGGGYSHHTGIAFCDDPQIGAPYTQEKETEFLEAFKGEVAAFYETIAEKVRRYGNS